MKFYSVPDQRLEKIKNFYSLDTTEVTKDELYSVKNKNILFVDDSIQNLLEKMKFPESNVYYACHVPKYFQQLNSYNIKLIPDITCIRTAILYKIKCRSLYNTRDIPFEEKKNNFIFAGSLYGAYDMKLNQRYKFSQVAEKCPNLCHLNIIKIKLPCDAEKRYEANKNINFQKIEKKWMEQSEIYKYKYIINIDGNGSRWGTITDLFSNSLMVRQDTSYKLFYEDLLQPFENYIQFSSDYFPSTLVNIKRYAESNKSKIREIIKKANETALKVIEKVNTWKF